MRTIAHISDVHFGRVDPPIAEALADDLHQLQPSLLVVSGDLTQRGRAGQYRAARDYLARLPQPQLVVPGNHDIPLFDIVRRFFFPLHRYRHFITRDLRPIVQDEEMLVLGINTARSFVPDLQAFWKGGKVSEEQLLDLELRVCSVPASIFKVIVTHHPFLPAPGEAHSDVVQKPARALAMFEQCGVDMLLAGHLHLNYTGEIREHHAQVKRSMISVHAGTATSTRHRGEPNSFNWITIDPPHVTIEVRTWDGHRFAPIGATRYCRQDDVWVRQD
jgi:3',5'-cyclic AMP phosphodiesterase CpdA